MSKRFKQKMSPEETAELEEIRRQISEHNYTLIALKEKLNDFIEECDHLKPNGTSAVYSGPGWHSELCALCGLDNDYGHLNEHLEKHHGYPKKAKKV